MAKTADPVFNPEQSLKLWESRLKYRESKLNYYRHKSKRPANEKHHLIVKWSNLVSEARKMVKKRRAQVAANKPLRLLALAEAEKLVGIMEVGGNNRGAKVTEIIRANGGTGPEPWCGDFQAYVYRAAGSKTVQRGWAAVSYIGRLTGQTIVKIANLLPGDLVCFTFDHVGMFVRWIDKAKGIMETIEGNTGASGAVSDSVTGGDGVYRKRRYVSQVSRGVRVTR